LKLAGGNLGGVLNFKAEDLMKEISQIIKKNEELRSRIISIGIPILMPDGKSLIRGPQIKIPVFKSSDELPVTNENLDEWTYNGWVDLRLSNIKMWLDRLNNIKTELDNIDPSDTSSHFHHGLGYWKKEDDLHIGRLVAWIFVNEEKGERVKD
jgi:hypothetical protein